MELFSYPHKQLNSWLAPGSQNQCCIIYDNYRRTELPSKRPLIELPRFCAGPSRYPRDNFWITNYCVVVVSLQRLFIYLFNQLQGLVMYVPYLAAEVNKKLDILHKLRISKDDWIDNNYVMYVHVCTCTLHPSIQLEPG